VVFWLLLAIGLLFTLTGLRRRIWWFLVIAFVLSLPISFFAYVDYGVLMLLPILQVAMAVGLRWSLGVASWIGLVLTAVMVWFVGIASTFVLHWPATMYMVALLGLAAGLVSLIWRQPPWQAERPG